MKKILLNILLLLSISLWAHPHVFIESSTTIIFNEVGIETIQVSLEWDEMYSATLINDYDTNNDNMFSLEEVERLEQFFNQYKQQNYFLDLVIDGQKLEGLKQAFFDVMIIDGKVYTEYSIIVDKPLTTVSQIELSVYDFEYYNEITTSTGNLFVEGQEFFELKFDYLLEDESKAYYMEQIYPSTLILEAKPKTDV